MLPEYAIGGIVPSADTVYLGLDRDAGAGIPNREQQEFRAVGIRRQRVE
jgi:hypothetical protein